jgi:hypothetical protein
MGSTHRARIGCHCNTYDKFNKQNIGFVLKWVQFIELESDAIVIPMTSSINKTFKELKQMQTNIYIYIYIYIYTTSFKIIKHLL